MDPEMRNTGNANGKRVRKPNTRFLNAPYVLGVSKRRKAEENVGNDELSRKSSIEQTNDGEPNAEKTAANSQNESVEQLDESSRGSCVKGTNGNELIVDETAESVKNIPTEHSVVNNTEASLKQVLEAVKSLTAEIETLKKQREEDRRLIDANSDKIKKLEDQVDKLKKCNNCNEIHKENTDLWCPECIKKEYVNHFECFIGIL